MQIDIVHRSECGEEELQREYEKTDYHLYDMSEHFSNHRID